VAVIFDYATVATLAAIVSTAVVAGVFFAFSSFVMPALARLSPPEGIRAMQSINITAVRPPLMIALFGTAVLAITQAIMGSGRPWTLAGVALYLVGVIGVTIVAHVPRNNSLAKVDALAPGAEDAWRRYLTGWGRWNHVRWITGVASSAAILASVI
jgi:uncharacterized membrane protein